MHHTNLRYGLLLSAVGLLLGHAAFAQPVVFGRTFDTGNHPLAGARIELVPLLLNYEAGLQRLAGREPEPVAAQLSDASGRYTLVAPAPGVWRIVVRANGQVPMQFGPLLLIEPTELPPVMLPADVGLRLQIKTENDLPVAGTWVFAVGTGGTSAAPVGDAWRPDFRAGKTTTDGTVTLARRESEQLTATVMAGGHAPQTRVGATNGVWKLEPNSGSDQIVRIVSPPGEGVPGVLVRIGESAWPVGLSDFEGKARLGLRGGGPVPASLLGQEGRQTRVLVPAASKQSQEAQFVLEDVRRITGRVLDAATRKPLPGALISLDDDPGRVVRSDQNGRFELTAPGPRRFSVTLGAAGFLRQRLWITAAQVAVGRAPTVMLDRASRIRGRVVGPSGQPLSGASVVAVAESALSARPFSSEDPVTSRTETDETGTFELRQLTPGQRFELRASRPGYFPSAFLAVSPRPSDAGPEARLQLLPTRAIQGVVEDADRRPLEGVSLRLHPSKRPGATGKRDTESDALATSDAAGRFLLTEVPAAEVDLEVSKPSFAPALRRGIRLPPGTGPVDVGKIVLHAGATLLGRVVDPRGEPVPQAEVFLVEDFPPRGLEEERLRNVMPDAVAGPDGRFRLQDQVSDAPLDLVVLAAGHLPGLVRGVRPAANSQPLTIRLDAAHDITGRVVSEDGEPIVGARLELRWQEILTDDPEQRAAGPVTYRNASSDRAGRFTLRRTPRGKARVDVAAHGFVPRTDLELLVPPPDPQPEWLIVLERGAILEGRVTTTAGDPVEGVRIGVGGVGGFSDGDGWYSIEGVPLGPQAVQAFHPSHRERVKQIQIEAGVNTLDFLLESGVEVSGRVIDEEGEPVVGAEVWLISRQREDLPGYHERSNQEGTFRFSSVARGRYTLGAEAPNQARARIGSAVIIDRENVAGLEIVVTEGAVLSGRILGLSPEELAIVEVEAQSPGRGSFPAQIDVEGQYEIRHLEAGDWQVRAALWHGQREVQARIPIGPADRQVWRDLEFRRRLTLSGQVLYEEEPLPDVRVSLRAQGLALERQAKTDFEGRFHLEDLEPDLYWLGLSQPSKRLVHNATLNLTADREVLIRLKAAILVGRVSDAASGAPIADALLFLRHPAGPEGPEFLVSGGTTADGTFTLYHVPPGTYQLTVRADGFSSVEEQVQILADQDPPPLDLRLNPATGLLLNVRTASGRIPALVHLLALGQEGGVTVAETLQTNAVGDVRVGSLAAGAWSLFVSGTRGAAVTASVVVPSEPLPLTLPDAARLHIRVPALTASDLRAELTIFDAAQQAFWTIGPGGRIEEQWLLTGGVATVEGLPAGVWTLHVKAVGGQTWSKTVATSGLENAFVSVD